MHKNRTPNFEKPFEDANTLTIKFMRFYIYKKKTFITFVCTVFNFDSFCLTGNKLSVL